MDGIKTSSQIVMVISHWRVHTSTILSTHLKFFIIECWGKLPKAYQKQTGKLWVYSNTEGVTGNTESLPIPCFPLGHLLSP